MSTLNSGTKWICPPEMGQFKQLLKEIHETLVWRSLVVKLSYSELQIISFFKQHETLMN